MNGETREYLLLVLPIEAMRCGKSYPSDESLPPHCTLMHWFYFDGELAILNEMLSIFASEVKCDIELVSKGPEFFGLKNNIPVHVLERNRELCDLHNKLFQRLAAAGCVFTQPRWLHAGYRPHVTDCKGYAFLPGSTHRATSIVLVSKDPKNMRKVLFEYPFG